MLTLRIPFPPSENGYRRAIAQPSRNGRKCRCGRAWTARQIISAKGRDYRTDVVKLIERLRLSLEIPTFTTDVKVRYTYHRGDRRKYDIGNYVKALDDALEAAKVYQDDSLIKDQRLIHGEVNPRDGFVLVQIRKL